MKKIIVFLIISSQFFFFACQEEERGQYPMDSIPPGKISSFEVENIEGGAIITYVLPKDEDVLYVKANYTLDDGTPMEVKTSAYSNNLIIVGIGKSRELVVKLYVVDRSQNESEPVTVNTTPLDSPIYSVLNSMKTQNDFGGIRMEWENTSSYPIIIEILSPDKNNEMVEVERFYTESKSGIGNLRGFEAVETLFAIVIKDRWGNITDTMSNTFTPIFEEELNKSKFARWNPPGIPYDAYTTSNWYIENLWDNSISNGFANHTTEFTFDMGQTAQLSRFKINQRKESNLCYAHGHPKRFELWGSKTPNVTDDFDTWDFIGYFESFKPSGLPLGEVSNEDIQYAHVQGEDWNVPLEAPSFRYLRFVSLETWGQANIIQVMEMSLWGDTSVGN